MNNTIRVKCCKEQHGYLELCCFNQQCKVNRGYYHQCLKTGDHTPHMKDQKNLMKLVDFFHNIDLESHIVISKLSQMIEEIKDLMFQLNQGLRKERLQYLNAEQLNSALNQIIQYDQIKIIIFVKINQKGINVILISYHLIYYFCHFTTSLKIDYRIGIKISKEFYSIDLYVKIQQELKLVLQYSIMFKNIIFSFFSITNFIFFSQAQITPKSQIAKLYMCQHTQNLIKQQQNDYRQQIQLFQNIGSKIQFSIQSLYLYKRNSVAETKELKNNITSKSIISSGHCFYTKRVRSCFNNRKDIKIIQDEQHNRLHKQIRELQFTYENKIFI
ncbi:unnamed protein product [Paramecium octaurelia]|uniref:Uncharacterized protein n=1 Tax=Paramecium octaurelia TaxID=43137 RepID=A0A8S1W9V0_PAROT|nr:unnamed protein product [Paramecium octaurelia]